MHKDFQMPMTQTTTPHLRLVTTKPPSLEQRFADELDAAALGGFAHMFHLSRVLARGWLLERTRSKRWQTLFNLARIEARAERELKHEARSAHYVQAEQLADARRSICGALMHLQNGDSEDAFELLTEAKALLDA